jgi:hypothetical protein
MGSNSGIISVPPTQQGEDVRLLACMNCKTIEVLDDYTGPQSRAEEYDVILNVALEKHKDGVERRPHAGQMFRVKKSDWDNPDAREQIQQQITEKFDPNAVTGLGAAAYVMRDTFREDAMTCWGQHNRNPGCPDYKSDGKQLVPGTNAERKEAGLNKFDPKNPATQRFLCEYCPVHSLVQQSLRAQAGMYDK